MKLRINIAVESDDGKAMRQVANGLSLTTSTPGLDHDAAKQDFLQQAEGLARTVLENQLPALYDTVDKEAEAIRADEAAAESRAKLQGKIAAVKKRRAEKEAQAQQEQAAQDTAQDVQNAVPDADDTVKCTDCGAEIPHDDAHYVTVVVGGKYNRDAVLCDACYDKVMAETRSASDGPETNAEPGDGEGE